MAPNLDQSLTWGARFFDESAAVLSRIDPSYWAVHAASAVRWADNMETLAGVAPACVVEVGSGSSLSPLLAEATSPAAADLSIISTLRHPKIDHAEGMADQLVFGEALGGLWEAGVPAAWGSYHREERHIKLALPMYALRAFGSTTTRRCTCARLRRS